MNKIIKLLMVFALVCSLPLQSMEVAEKAWQAVNSSNVNLVYSGAILGYLGLNSLKEYSDFRDLKNCTIDKAPMKIDNYQLLPENDKVVQFIKKMAIDEFNYSPQKINNLKIYAHRKLKKGDAIDGSSMTMGPALFVRFNAEQLDQMETMVHDPSFKKSSKYKESIEKEKKWLPNWNCSSEDVMSYMSLWGSDPTPDTLAMIKGAIAHELGHDYNNHYIKDTFFPCVVAGLAQAGECGLRFLFPNNPISKYPLVSFAAKIGLAKIANWLHTKHYEYQADGEVIKRIHNPEILHAMKKFYETGHANRKMCLYSDYPRYGYFAEKIPFLYHFAEPHPSSYSRAKRFEKAAEIEQKNADAKNELSAMAMSLCGSMG